MDKHKTAIILIGYQNDYFAEDGILTAVIDESSKNSQILANTVDLLRHVDAGFIAATPIVFTPDYSELVDPVGILKTIVETGAFQKDTQGVKTIDELAEFEDKITEVPGKIGLNAFRNTQLDELLKEFKIENVVLAGAVASICVDSTGRAAAELGYNVTILSDCLSGRSVFEQEFYCESIYPLYASVLDHQQLLAELK